MPGEWLAQLPEDLRTNETLTGHATLGDFAKSHLEAQGKLKEFDGKVKVHEGKIGDLEKKLGDSISKLPENATDEEKHIYYMQIGKPEKADDYDLPKPENGNADPDMVKWAKSTFHSAHLNKEQATAIGQAWNTYIAGRTKAEVELRGTERTEAESKLKTEWGDQYDGNVEMIRRVWSKNTESEFDAFVNETKIGNHPTFLKLIAKFAKLTGEDKSIHVEPSVGIQMGTFAYPDMKK